MARLQRRNYGRGHGYKLDGEKILGVTTVLGAKAKDALIDWAARTTAEHAVDHWDELGGMPPSQRLTHLVKARWEVSSEAAARGTQIHALGEKLASGAEVDVLDPLRGPVEAYARFLDRWQIDPFATEWPCANTEHLYAGTGDLVASIGRRDEEMALIDVKTGKGVYPETALQLAAYRYTDLWQPNGPASECSMRRVDAVYVAHVLSDDVRLIPIDAGKDEWRIFLYLLQVARWDAAVKDDPVTGAALNPEDVNA